MSNLPKAIANLIEAQNHFDSAAYAECFSETAIVFDEGKKYTGKAEIRKWISEANEKYKAVMKPIGFTSSANAGVLSAEISGSFDASPIVLKYYFEINAEHIQSLKITS